LFIYLTPFIPLSFKGERGGIFKRGEASLGLPFFTVLLGVFLERGEAPLLPISPFP